MQEREGENYWNIIRRCQKGDPLGVADLATLLLDLATFQTPLVFFCCLETEKYMKTGCIKIHYVHRE